MPCPHDHGCHNVQQQSFSLTSLADADCEVTCRFAGTMEVERLRHVQSHIVRSRPAVQTGQQFSTAVLCTTGHVVRCCCDSNGANLYDSSHLGHYNIVCKLVMEWSIPSQIFLGIPIFLKLLATHSSAVQTLTMQCLCSHIANMSCFLFDLTYFITARVLYRSAAKTTMLQMCKRTLQNCVRKQPHAQL